MPEYSYDLWYVFASFAVVLMAGFTGLSLTRGASALSIQKRKLVVSMSAIALGGGIWSMHFVAMLGMRLPMPFYYDALTTMISALLAILIVGIALLVVHFSPRNSTKITIAGMIVGLGVPVMHYVGMSGIRFYQPAYSTSGILIALGASVILSITAFWLAYGNRIARNIILGTFGFGISVFAVHFIAMAGTQFTRIDGIDTPGPLISNAALAFGLTISVFVISGAFLLTSVTFLQPGKEQPHNPVPQSATQPKVDPRAPLQFRIPYEKDGRTHFIEQDAIAAIQAEGHYTLLYVGDQKLFCPWSITKMEDRIPKDNFIRTHRSYLVNKNHVSSFERKKDSGICYFSEVEALSKAPVSRSRLIEVRQILGL